MPHSPFHKSRPSNLPCASKITSSSITAAQPASANNMMATSSLPDGSLLSVIELQDMERLALALSISASGGWANGFSIPTIGEQTDIAAAFNLPFEVTLITMHDWGYICDKLIFENDKLRVQFNSEDGHWCAPQTAIVKHPTNGEISINLDMVGPWNDEIRSIIKQTATAYENAMQSATDRQQKAIALAATIWP